MSVLYLSFTQYGNFTIIRWWWSMDGYGRHHRKLWSLSVCSSSPCLYLTAFRGLLSAPTRSYRWLINNWTNRAICSWFSWMDESRYGAHTANSRGAFACENSLRRRRRRPGRQHQQHTFLSHTYQRVSGALPLVVLLAMNNGLRCYQYHHDERKSALKLIYYIIKEVLVHPIQQSVRPDPATPGTNVKYPSTVCGCTTIIIIIIIQRRGKDTYLPVRIWFVIRWKCPFEFDLSLHIYTDWCSIKRTFCTLEFITSFYLL